jgi:hypothetical protein
MNASWMDNSSWTAITLGPQSMVEGAALRNRPNCVNHLLAGKVRLLPAIKMIGAFSFDSLTQSLNGMRPASIYQE